MTLSRESTSEAQPTQNERVLGLLRERGSAGLNSAELAELPTCDGGPPIRRIAARIDNLKHRGCTVSSRRESNGTATYFLLAEPEIEQAPSRTDQEPPGSGAAPSLVEAAPAESPGGLFDADAFARPAMFDTERAA